MIKNEIVKNVGSCHSHSKGKEGCVQKFYVYKQTSDRQNQISLC